MYSVPADNGITNTVAGMDRVYQTPFLGGELSLSFWIKVAPHVVTCDVGCHVDNHLSNISYICHVIMEGALSISSEPLSNPL